MSGQQLVQPLFVSNTPLAAGATFTSVWYDSFNLATSTLSVTCLSDQGGGLVVQETDDQSLPSAILTLLNAPVAAGGVFRAYVPIRHRYFQLIFTNGGGAQTTFELTADSFSYTPFNIDSNGNLIVTGSTGTSPNAPTIVSALDSTGTSDFTRMRQLQEAMLQELRVLNFMVSQLKDAGPMTVPAEFLSLPITGAGA